MLNRNFYNFNLGTATKVFLMIIFQVKYVKVPMKVTLQYPMLSAITLTNFNTLMPKNIQKIQLSTKMRFSG